MQSNQGRLRLTTLVFRYPKTRESLPKGARPSPCDPGPGRGNLSQSRPSVVL